MNERVKWYDTTLAGMVLLFLFSSAVFAQLAPEAAGGWTVTSNLFVKRRGHTATLLADGKVLIVGSALAANIAEVYEPTNGSFVRIADTQRAHGDGATATRLIDGRVLIVGGDSSPDFAELYDPVTQNFAATGGLISARSLHTATLLDNGTVLIAGGLIRSGSSSTSLATAEIYNPQSGIFTPTGSLNIARASAGAALLPNGRVLIAGGLRVGLDPGIDSSNSAELYDPASGAFTRTGNMQRSRQTPRAVAVSAIGKVLVLGDFLGVQTSAELFDPSTGSFSLTGTPVTNISGSAVATLPNGLVMVCGGSIAVGPVVTSAAQVYDPLTGTFSPIAPMQDTRQQQTLTLLQDGKLLAVGGYSSSSGGSDLLSAEVYDAGPDFGLAMANAVVNVSRGTKVKVTINIVRTGEFTGNVTVTPANSSRVKVTPGEPLSTVDSSVGFKLKIKAGAAIGSRQLTFIGKDDNNRMRATTVTLVIGDM